MEEPKFCDHEDIDNVVEKVGGRCLRPLISLESMILRVIVLKQGGYIF